MGRPATLTLCLALLLVWVAAGTASLRVQADGLASRGGVTAGIHGSRRRHVLAEVEGPLPSGENGAPAAENLTATYRGEWIKLAWPHHAVAQPAVLRGGRGAAVFKLRNLRPSKDGEPNVEGEAVLRDGEYVSSTDLSLHLKGVYDPDRQQLIAVLTPTKNISLPPGAQEQMQREQQQQEDWLRQYEQHLDGVWGDKTPLPRFRRLVGGGLPAGQDIARLGSSTLLPWQQAKLEAAGLSAAAAAAMDERPGWQVCEFTLEAHVYPEGGGRGGAEEGQVDGEEGGTGSGSGSGGDSAVLGHRAMPGHRRKQPEAAAQAAAHTDASGSGGSGRGSHPRLYTLNGTLSSAGCGIRVQLSVSTVHLEQYYSRAVSYTSMITLLGFLQALLLVRQMEACSTPTLAARVSITTLAHQAVLDAYLCLVHLTLGVMVQGLMHSFATVAFTQFVVFAVFEMRFLLSVWRARHGSVDPWTAQREISLVYARFYAALLGGIILTYRFQRHMPLLMFGFFGFWWPQIWLCIRNDHRQPLKPEYILGTSAVRLALPCYVWLCPANLLRVHPNPGLCAALTAYVGLQCFLLLAQRWRGSRCFVPKQLLPRRYDYSRPVVLKSSDDSLCAICMNGVDISHKAQRATTPCGHLFHRHCLERWMQVKFECPTCRRPLPPV